MALWKEIARLEQQHFLQIFGSTDWDLYRPEEKKLLSDKVGLVIFGPPRTKYEGSQVALIKKVSDVIVQEGEHGSPDGTWMSIIIVFVKPTKGDYFCHPVFRVPKYSDGSNKQHAFIDCIGRVYKSWSNFLKDNKLPKCEICYPVNGIYRKDMYGDVVIDFACCKPNMLLKVADGANNLLALGSIGVATTAMALPVAAPVLTAVAIVGVASGIYGAARATHDQVDRKKHGQTIGLTELKSLGNWGNIVGGVMGVGPGIKCIQLGRSLSKTAKLGVMMRAVGALRTPSVTPQEMFRDIRAKAMLLQDLSAYVLLMCHTVADNVYVADFLNSGNNILHMKSKLFTMVEHKETVRRLEFASIESGELREVLSKGICEYSSKFQLSFSCSVEMFDSIKKYISECIDRNLTGLSLKGAIPHMRVIIDFFAQHDFTLAFDLCQKALALTNFSPSGRALLGLISGLYLVLKNVIDSAQSRRNVTFSAMKPTSSDIIEIIKICIFDHGTFVNKLSKLFLNFIVPTLTEFLSIGLILVLQKYIYLPNVQNLNSISEEEALRVASDLVGSHLDVSNAKVTYAKDEIYVIITDANINISVVEIVWEKEHGRVDAKVFR